MTFNGKNNQPRNRSTNMRSLNNRLTQLQKEMNPQVSVSGLTRTLDKKQWVTRKYVHTLPMSNSSLTVSAGSASLPDGCKVLKVVLRNLSGRTLTCAVPSNTALLEESATGTSDSPFGGFTKYAAAPLSRFPKLVLQVPDLLARPLDTTAFPGPTLFTVGSVLTNQTDTVEMTFTVRYAL